MAGKSIEERIVLLDAKIADQERKLEELKAQREKLLHPISMRGILAKAKEQGWTPYEIAEKLGLDV